MGDCSINYFVLGSYVYGESCLWNIKVVDMFMDKLVLGFCVVIFI